MSEPYIALQVVMLPRDANPLPTFIPGSGGKHIGAYSTIFGGVILSYLDTAGAIGGRREVVRAGGQQPFLTTVAMNKVEFKKPVLVGDVVRFLTRVVRIGRTSITVHVTVEADRAGETLQVTEAEVVYVGIDLSGPEPRPIPLVPGG